MKRVKSIGLIRNNDSKIIGDLIFSLFKNNGMEVGLISDGFIRVNEDCKKRRLNDQRDIERLLGDENSLDYIIFDNLQEKSMYDLTKQFEINTLIDDEFMGGNKQNNRMVETKINIFNNLKRNGIAIINSDNKTLNDYFSCLKDKIIVTYGLNTKSTITASSLDINGTVSFNCCIQRGITTFNGNEIEQMEFPIRTMAYDDFNVCDFLAAISLALIYEVSIDNIQNTIYSLDYS
ncbi:MAG: Mur ligase family protein [Maledivibacter sp.]|jgi:UDP-N-acetylmuramoyl-L-alanyl-D-glutamate--2,6-diaminopimelate ligase|nr:Mur ligase family protein [Maledivibacter sp.]